MKKYLLALAGAALTLVPCANATSPVQVLGAGSSAQWQTAGYAAWHDLAGSNAGHWTIKGVQLLDSRGGATNPIPAATGNLWVVWNSAQTEVWAFLSIDSVVGNRAYFAQPRAYIGVQSSWTTTAGANLISANLWGSDASALPQNVYNALNTYPHVTAAFTDIRPEDALFAQTRAVSALTSTYSGLGYGTGASTLVGTPVYSHFSSSTAQPVAFGISGYDPFTKTKIPSWTTISVGASPIVFLINRTNPNGLGSGQFTNITDSQAQNVFSGTECDTNALGGSNADTAIYPVLREPISGTMNTTEFTVFRIKADPNQSQEANVGQPAPGTNSNPLNLACNSGGGSRYRAIGTGEVVNSGILSVQDSIGYAFFGYGNFSKIAQNPSYGYLKLDGVDPISASYTNGELPACTAPCPATPGSSFPTLRNGTYRAWSVLRVATDASGANYTNVKALVTAVDTEVNNTVPDFVPFQALGGDPGLKYYRSHYKQSGISPNNGLSGQKESGGDVGGCIEPVTSAPGVLSCHQ